MCTVFEMCRFAGEIERMNMKRKKQTMSCRRISSASMVERVSVYWSFYMHSIYTNRYNIHKFMGVLVDDENVDCENTLVSMVLIISVLMEWFQRLWCLFPHAYAHTLLLNHEKTWQQHQQQQHHQNVDKKECWNVQMNVFIFDFFLFVWKKKRYSNETNTCNLSGNCTFIYCLYEICSLLILSLLSQFSRWLVLIRGILYTCTTQHCSLYTFNAIWTFFDFERLPIMLSSQKQNNCLTFRF